MNEATQTVRKTLLVGLGSPHGDDRAGWAVAARVVELEPAFDVRSTAVPVDVTHWLEGVERLVVCDASEARGEAGRIRRWEWPTDELAGLRSSGTHDFGLEPTLGLLERLGRLPEFVTVFAVEGERFEPGAALSERVVDAAEELSRMVLEELRGARGVAGKVAAATGGDAAG